ncbi:MAG: ABC transporter permease [Candidatus Hermodarchaeota archaeon]
MGKTEKKETEEQDSLSIVTKTLGLTIEVSGAIMLFIISPFAYFGHEFMFIGNIYGLTLLILSLLAVLFVTSGEIIRRSDKKKIVVFTTTNNTVIKIISIYKKIFSNSFLRMAVKKGIFYFVVFFVALTLAFLIPRLVPGNILEYIYQRPSGVPQEVWDEMIKGLEEFLGLNYPLHIQYINFLRSFFLEFDFGYSTLYRLEPVINIIGRTLPYTLMLVVPVLIITFYIGNWIGARAGYSGKKKDKIAYYVFMILQTAPFFWMAYVIMDLFVVQLNMWYLNPYYGTVPPWPRVEPGLSMAWVWDWEAWDAISAIFTSFWLPFVVLIITNIGGWATGAYSLMTFEKGEDYIAFTNKLGFRNKKMRKYAFRNSMLPQFTGLNLRFNGLIGATLITEVIFNFPGIGLSMFEAFNQQDYNLIIGLFIVTIIVVVLGNYLIDMCYVILDPRIRVGGKGE